VREEPVDGQLLGGGARVKAPVEQLGEQAGAELALVILAQRGVRDLDRGRGRRVLEEGEVEGLGARALGDEEGRLLVGNLDRDRPAVGGGLRPGRAAIQAQQPGYRPAPPGQGGEHSVPKLHRRDPRAVEHRLAGRAVQHVETAAEFPLEPAHEGGRVAAGDSQVDGRVDPPGAGQPSRLLMGRRVGHGPAEHDEANRVGRAHQRQVQGLGALDGPGGDLGRVRVGADDQCAGARGGEPLD
jgi:hypothetical protein